MVSGHLSTADVGRLEHACSPALTSANPHLDIHLQRVTQVDAAAAMFLKRLAARGAGITQALPAGVNAGMGRMARHPRRPPV